MKRKALLFVLLFGCAIGIGADELSLADFKFLVEREQFQLIDKYWDQFLQLKDTNEINAYLAFLDYAERTDDPLLAAEMHYRLAAEHQRLEDALNWLALKPLLDDSDEQFTIKADKLKAVFSSPADGLILEHYLKGEQEDEITDLIGGLEEYNSVIEAIAKGYVDQLSIMEDRVAALQIIDSFYQLFPHSKWHQAIYYIHLIHLSALKDYAGLMSLIDSYESYSAAHSFISASFLLNPNVREGLGPNREQIERAMSLFEKAKEAQATTVFYDEYSSQDWQARLSLQSFKSRYYLLLADNCIEDESEAIRSFERPSCSQKKLLKEAKDIRFMSNDRGEEAELNYWIAKYYSLFKDKTSQKEAIRHYGYALIKGAPHKRYEQDSTQQIEGILEFLKIDDKPLSYLRKLFQYNSITFEDTNALPYARYSRVALADYDNDGLIDILLNGKHLYKNDGNFSFTAVQDSALASLNSSGGIFADFNKDGILDLVSISHSTTDEGDSLMKQNPDGSFVKVNAKAGDINDKLPTEGVAFIDINGLGYPSLYLANYERWGEQIGFQDFFWHNDKGTFTEKSAELGFLSAPYTTEPGLAGRGVAPADYDNDGKQEILVTNYRLMRNLLFKQKGEQFTDLATLNGVAGQLTDGYYGHSIGADWGDIDNDGDLDLFIANLAHPRFISFSDKSFLYRNDGLKHYVVGADTLYYWAFTDITKEAGITFEETHSEPLFFDADNDGLLDIYITSVYENERSYLYLNNGDGTFTDISYLSGSRVFNGWSCAAADLDRDGLIDLVVGSGNGSKVLKNTTPTANKSLFLKPIHKDDKILIHPVDKHDSSMPNSPAFGSRVLVRLKDKKGKIHCLTRELSSAKGTSTQNAPELHFGLGTNKLMGYKLWQKP